MQIIKRILGVNRATTNILVKGEINRHSLQEEILRRNIKYAKYLHQKIDSSLVKQAYNYELERPIGSTTFFSTIKKHCEALQTLHAQFIPYRVPYENIYEIKESKLKLYTHGIFHNKWINDLQESRKGDTYKTFKQRMKYEKYLDYLNL